MRRSSLLLVGVAAGCSSSPAQGPAARDAPAATAIALPGGDGGIGFDDLSYSPRLARVLVPAGRTGALDLIDAVTHAVSQIEGFTSEASYRGGHGEGTTSAVDAGPWLLAIDRSAMELVVIDPERATIVHRAKLGASPDYVRWVDATAEAWVTEPDAEQIECFSVATDGTAHATTTIRVAGGPESLVAARDGAAYTHLWSGSTARIDAKTHAVTATWTNGCHGSRGIALDEDHGWLFTGCSEGKATVLDTRDEGNLLGAVDVAAGVDIIAYAPSSRRLYVPSASTGDLSVIAVADDGALSRASTIAVARGAHCVTSDDAGRVWVCDPDRGRILAFYLGRASHP
jgi:DNA-binding beta-propeller fold protein YncE